MTDGQTDRQTDGFGTAESRCAMHIYAMLSATKCGTGRGKLVTLIADKRHRLLFTGDDDELFMTRILNVTLRQQNSI